ncbi:MAG: DUF4168 domain-containing protein [Bacteroidota bacterium]|nr:DUF4168 domain-containing protein [Bacteroidota bacterium]
MKNNIKNFSIILFSLLIFASAFAQEQKQPQQEQNLNQMLNQEQKQIKTDYSDKTLSKFIEASKSIDQIQQQTEQEMIKVVEKENLNVERFNEIAQAQQNPEAELDVTEKELKSFETAVGQFQKIQEQMQSKMENAIKEKNIELDEYKEIMFAYQQNQEFQKKINSLLQK